MRNNERGITLVALVVTIVVLLILAGITITYVLSDNGIFGTAKTAAKETARATIESQIGLTLVDIQTSFYVPGSTAITAEAASKKVNDALTAVGATGTIALTITSGTNAISATATDVTLDGHTFSVTINTATGTPVTVADK